MGLIILPLMIMWLVASLYTLRMGYHLMSGNPFLSFALPIIIIAMLVMFSYLYMGLSSFKHNTEIWAFEIPMFFLAGKSAILIFTIVALVNFFYASKIHNIYILAGMFIVMFTLSSSALIGAFSSDSFIQKHSIKVTY
ncbi:MAG: hypothetical protein JXR16_03200 [Bermanella sp.]